MASDEQGRFLELTNDKVVCKDCKEIVKYVHEGRRILRCGCGQWRACDYCYRLPFVMQGGDEQEILLRCALHGGRRDG